MKSLFLLEDFLEHSRFHVFHRNRVLRLRDPWNMAKNTGELMLRGNQCAGISSSLLGPVVNLNVTSQATWRSNA